MKVVARFHSPLTSKFGTPRQAGVVSSLPGVIVFDRAFRSPDAIRGIEGFDYLWLIWGFSANRKQATPSAHDHDTSPLTVRPPRLGGNERVGVFASRSPYRPNAIGLSSVKIHHIDYHAPDAPVIHVEGADLIDGTPIYDIKPYIPYTDAHPEARGGFTDQVLWRPLRVVLSAEAEQQLSAPDYQALSDQRHVWQQLLQQDPRPHYHDDPQRRYAMSYAGYDILFTVADDTLTVVDIRKL